MIKKKWVNQSILILNLVATVYAFGSGDLNTCTPIDQDTCLIEATKNFTYEKTDLSIYATDKSKFVIREDNDFQLIEGDFLLQSKKGEKSFRQRGLNISFELSMLVSVKAEKMEFTQVQGLSRIKDKEGNMFSLYPGFFIKYDRGGMSVPSLAKKEDFFKKIQSLKKWDKKEALEIGQIWSNRERKAQEVYREVASALREEEEEKEKQKREKIKKIEFENQKYKDLFKKRFYYPEEWDF